MDDRQRYFYGISQAYQKRWDRVTDARTDLQAELLETEVLWGKSLINLIGPINALERELYLAVLNHITIINPESEPETKAAYIEIKRKKRDILYDQSGDEPDEYMLDLTKAISTIEDHLKPHLSL